MLMQEKINAPDTLLKLYVAINEELKALHPELCSRCLIPDLLIRSTEPCETGLHILVQPFFTLAPLRALAA